MAKLNPSKDGMPVSSLKPLSPAAQRALAEADERRRLADVSAAPSVPKVKEIGGRDGPDPTRYGDWEVKGIISDF
jgi:hypothetical protein